MRTALLALGVLTSLSCAGPQIDPVARVSPNSRYKYEIELHARINVYGGPCNPTCIPTRVDDSHWIYVNRLEGQIAAQDLLLTYEREKFASPQSALKGSLTIADGVLTVDFLLPCYKGRSEVPDHYTSYRYNGRYELRSRGAD